MRILLDESMPRRLANELPEHQVDTVAKCGWGGIKNGALLALAASNFDVFITGDQQLRYQQNLSKFTHRSHCAGNTEHPGVDPAAHTAIVGPTDGFDAVYADRNPSLNST